MTTNDWALDTNYAMQQGVRRLISGCVEAADGRLWLPERALTLASDRHSRLARTRAARITEHREGAETPARSRAALDDITIERTLALTDTFATWAQAETLRNDGLWSLAASSAHTRRLTQRLFIAGIAQEGHADTAEEDAHVAAEALSAGCRWISSNNLDMLQGKLFTKWLGVEQAQGRLTGARARSSSAPTRRSPTSSNAPGSTPRNTTRSQLSPGNSPGQATPVRGPTPTRA